MKRIQELNQLYNPFFGILTVLLIWEIWSIERSSKILLKGTGERFLYRYSIEAYFIVTKFLSTFENLAWHILKK